MFGERYSRVSRRNFLADSVKYAAGIATIAAFGCSENKPQYREPTLADKIKAQEAEIGQNFITLDRAAELIDTFYALYTQNYDTNYKLSELKENSFVVRGDFAPGDNPVKDGRINIEIIKNSEGIKNMQRDYPNLKATDAELYDLWLTSQILFAVTYIPTNRMYLFLDNINKFYIETTSYTEDGPLVKCTIPTPFKSLMYACTHEATHMDAKESQIPQELTDAILKNTKGRQVPQKQNGFYLTASDSDKKVILKIINLEEITADYLAQRLLHKNSLSYGISTYTGPVDLLNFGKILESTAISDEQFSKLHRYGLYTEFLNILGKKANQNLLDKSSQDTPLISAVKIADLIAQKPIDWSQIKKYFPQIDDTKYFYHGFDLKRGADVSTFVPGCILN